MVRFSSTVIVPSCATVMLVANRWMCHSFAKAGSARKRLTTKIKKIRLLHSSFLCPSGFLISRVTTKSDADSESYISELHGHRIALRGLGNVEELPGLEVEHAGNDVRRERLDLGVEVANHRVVIAARVLDGVFQSAQRALQRLKLFGGAQLGISLGHSQ